MLYDVNRDSRGNITAPVSAYQPKKDELDCIKRFTMDMEMGHLIMHKSYNEFNRRSVIEEINVNQRSFNSYVPPRSDDPDESWRAQTIRPIVRNKLISIASHVTLSTLYPNVFAQNTKSEEDKDTAMVMRDLIEWVINNSNYSRSFVLGVISALVNPAVITNAEFAEVMRTVKEMQKDGSYTKKEVLDEIFSGFFFNLVPPSELYIANIYEPNIQRQRFLIRHKLIDFQEAKIVHGKRPNFKYVQPGVRAVYVEKEDTFYDQFDESLNDSLVSEDTYYNRYLDIEEVYANGILISDAGQPMKRTDKLYPFAKSGYEPLNDGMFFYYKSAANKLGPDEDLINTLYNMIMDGTFLSLMPPMALYGNEEIGSSVMVPGTITSLRENTKLESLSPRSDIRAGIEAITITEKSITESSQDQLQAGISGGQTRTASEILLVEQNAKIALGLFGKSVGFLVEDLGKLMIGDIIDHVTVPEIDKIAGPNDPLKYKTILVPDKVMSGKKVTKSIQFSADMMGKENQTSDQQLSSSFSLLQQEGGMESDLRIVQVNPELFREMKYKVTVSVDKLTPQNKAIEKALNLELYDRAIANPLSDQESITRDFLFETYKPGESDKYMKKGPDMSAMMGAGAGPTAKPNSNLVGQITGNSSLKTLMTAGGSTISPNQ